MARALQLAARGTYSTAPNPAVGCVLLDAAGALVGEGWHQRAGQPHAEVFALRTAAEGARGGTAYVTLEPCSHHGRTPPCADALIEAGVRRVVAAMQDPNPHVAGDGLRKLEAAGMVTTVGMLEREARALNRGFVARMTRGRPWVTVKLGSSADGRTALADGSSRWITSEAARADVQRLRARASAIVTGIGTALADDPALTVRDQALDLGGRVPLRVVLDSRGRFEPGLQLARDGLPTLVFSSDAGAQSLAHLAEARPAALQFEPMPADAAGRIDLHATLQRLAALECNEVLVEAGPRLAGSFLAAGLVDEIVLYVAPTILGDTAQPSFVLPQPLRALSERPQYSYHDVRQVGPDLRLTLRPVETRP
ncbi:MAG: bifunctional diaminohydroxyphosphoribosylaminopyrimidine deaminase/5-amino-6-(5-phosphoribosylamino)uracil reductase RibD [Steroidobacteraceae bacterium]|nr:bifunctional diaminohydroxyphosphoribosylaminopyrimidine deaminase/5-amino-6-(5-phosphoribosylamino)uracil reductase RibD [Steroidobacteraceae bacterium]MBP9130214.1 bifunctional diaminohydroxyphosphoribosylaminopyrimidine deaminase/5-amino-6-(5-phosphoribosylamino)uracil reductase RibD [Steroidobacteraceae bacterium]